MSFANPFDWDELWLIAQAALPIVLEEYSDAEHEYPQW